MRRMIVISLLFLLAGAVVNVAVAWGCAVWAPLGGQTQLWVVPPEEYVRLLSQIPGDPPDEPWMPRERATRISGIGVHHELMWAWNKTEQERQANTIPRPPTFSALAVQRWRVGLPLASCEGLRADRGGVRWRQHALVPPPWLSAQPFRVLPLRPIWPGFAVNTAFYAAILWLLIPGPFALRRLIRRRRGRCPSCAYPMGESSVCSECGQSLPVREAVA